MKKYDKPTISYEERKKHKKTLLDFDEDETGDEDDRKFHKKDA